MQLINPLLARDVGYLRTAIGGIQRNLQNKDDDSLSVLDFVVSGASAAANVAGIQKALDYAATVGQAVWFPLGTFNLNDTLVVPANVKVYGNATLVMTVEEKNIFELNNDCTVTGLHLTGPNTGVAPVDFDKCNAIYAIGKRNLVIEDNVINGWAGAGIQTRNCYNYSIKGNMVYGGYFGVGSSSDIVTYSTVGGGRIIITENLLFSNNSQGIFFDAIGLDADAVISDNIIVTLAADWSEVVMPTTPGSYRRHAIVCAYNGGLNGGRAIITGNVCRNTLWTGIYAQSANTSAPILISDNYCSDNGYELGNSLSANIWGDCQGHITVNDNICERYRGNTTGGIFMQSAADVVNSGLIEDNTIISSAGTGISLSGRLRNTDVKNNRITDPGSVGILVTLQPGVAACGGLDIVGNSVICRSGTYKTGIYYDQGGGLKRSQVRNNRFFGIDATTINAANAAIVVNSTNSAQYVSFKNNDIDTYYYGVYYTGYFTVSTRYTGEFADYNSFRNVALAIMANATNTSSTVAFVGNTFDNVTTKFANVIGGNCGYQALRMGTAIQVYGLNAAPTVGTWAVGDIVVATTPVVNGTSMYECTVAGTPGTFQPLGIVGAIQAATVAAPIGGSVIDVEARAAIASMLTSLKNAKLMSI